MHAFYYLVHHYFSADGTLLSSPRLAGCRLAHALSSSQSTQLQSTLLPCKRTSTFLRLFMINLIIEKAETMKVFFFQK